MVLKLSQFGAQYLPIFNCIFLFSWNDDLKTLLCHIHTYTFAQQHPELRSGSRKVIESCVSIE